MRVAVKRWFRVDDDEYELATRDVPLPHGHRLDLRDEHAAARVLWRMLSGAPSMRALYEVLDACGGVDGLDDETVVARAALLVAHDRLRIAVRRVPVYGAGEPTDEDDDEGETTPEDDDEDLPEVLDITDIDDHFAPSVERLDITYRIQNMTPYRVQLRIHGGGGVLFERDLDGAEKSDGGGKRLHWDGVVHGGARDGRHATPLMAPFRAELVADNGMRDEEPFKILYHSLTLAWGRHTPDGTPPPESEQVRRAQFQLMELGYDGGPVNGTLGAVTQAAITRFQRGHYRVGTQTLLTESGALDADTVAALAAAAARTRWSAGDALTADSRLYVDDDFYNDRGADMVTAPTSPPEFNSQDRKRYVEDRLERPYVALEATVRLLSKANQGVEAPDAVGAAPVAWEADDATEDASVVPAGTNALGRAYVQHAREVNAAGSASAARVDTDGDNAPVALWGVRDTTPAATVRRWFPNDSDSRLAPYSVTGYASETRAGRVRHQAVTPAWDHASDHPRCKGRAGAYFRHSTKGGDDAKVRVGINFDGLSNAALLRNLHAPHAATLFAEAGRWTLWRRSKLNAYCQQAAPTRVSGSPNWAQIAAWWSEAFYEFEAGGSPATVLNYATLVTQAVYNATVLAMPASHRPPGVASAANLTYRATQVYGGPPIAQGPGETAAAYVVRARLAMQSWCVNVINALLAVVHREVRKTAAEGLIIYDFRVFDPISGSDWDPTANGGAGGWVPTANPAAQNITSGTPGYVRLDGAVTMNVDNGFNVHCYVLHECGHARFLYHHKTGGGGAGNPSDNPAHHDADQERCAMSYGITPFTPNTWFYPFCGKCLMRLRGWDALSLPNRYAP